MSLTFREQIEATAWELGNGEGTMPELRKRFDADPETPNFDPAKALEMLHILQLINYKQAEPDRDHRTAEGRRVKRPEDHRAHRHQPAARRRVDQQPLRTEQPEHLRQRQTIPADERPEIGRFRGPDEQGGGERIG